MKSENEQVLNQATMPHPAGALPERVVQDLTPHANTAEPAERAYEAVAAELVFPEETRTLPFIMPHTCEKVMVEDWHDEPLRVHIVLVNDIATNYLTPEDQRKIEDQVESVVEGLPKTFSLPMGHLLELSFGEPYITLMPPSLTERLTVKQRRWLHNGLYAQVGFSVTDGNFYFDLGRPIAMAMTLLDAEVVGSNSVFMANHTPKKIVGFADRELAFEIGLVFDPSLGVADWNNSLLPLRNELLVKIGAVLRNLDPKEELRRFVGEGHDYFLDFTFGKV